jgi:thiol-disulfide isomerase/thioredoxin
VRILVALILFIAATLLLIAAGIPPRNTSPYIPVFNNTPVLAAVARTAPPFDARTLAGGTYSFRAGRGTPTIINFWATWCIPCRLEMPALQAAQEAYPNIRIIGVNFGESPEVVREWSRTYGINYDLVLDTSGRISAMYSAYALPTTVFIAADGTIRLIEVAALDETAIRDHIETFLLP